LYIKLFEVPVHQPLRSVGYHVIVITATALFRNRNDTW